MSNSTETTTPLPDFAQYRSIRKMNASTIVHGFRSMLRLKRAIEGDVPETAAMRFGQQYHELILEPTDFERHCVVRPEYRTYPENVTANGGSSESKNTKWVKEQEAKFAKDNPGKIVVDQKYYDSMLYMLESLHTHPLIPKLLEASQKEFTLTGTICHTEFKGRVDLLDLIGEWGITDLKGTNNVQPWAFGATCINFHYPEKMAIYRELCRQTFDKVLPVHIIAVETAGDFDRCLIPLRDEVLDHAFGRVSRLVLQYENAVETGSWPGVDGGEELVEFAPPNYWLPDSDEEWQG